ncbi:Ig-like domain-containing protein [Microbulbifer sp. ALW1]|uniref:Ig-like domain-containing protein n=1 Tax=Microbulbifer sp. (strain ALW1) TaxID=1516059 RepID=UPI001359DB10|nr:Ig-like domain-containing protein [Microbulbifer sp. ALW1]
MVTKFRPNVLKTATVLALLCLTACGGGGSGDSSSSSSNSGGSSGSSSSGSSSSSSSSGSSGSSGSNGSSSSGSSSGGSNENSAPVVGDAEFTTDEDTPLEGNISASDPDEDSLSYEVNVPPSHGRINLTEAGHFNFLPDADFYGADSFQVHVSDGVNEPATSTISITVRPVNDAPSIQPATAATRNDAPITLTLDASDIDEDPLTYQIVQAPQQGEVTLNEDGTLTYQPNSGITGPDQFTIEASDSIETATALITIENGLAYMGQVVGDLSDTGQIEIILSSASELMRTVPDTSGAFRFYSVPDGDYSVKARAAGYQSAPAKTLQLNGLPTTLTDYGDGLNTFELSPIPATGFHFHWEEDQSLAGYDYSSHLNEPVTVEFLGESISVIDESAAQQLQHDYNILLVDGENTAWTQEHAYRLLETLKSIPQTIREYDKPQQLPASKWILSKDHQEDDIEITTTGSNTSVIISDKAFVNAEPRLAAIDGKRGSYYSQRLHHALVRFVTDNGADVGAYEKILNERFGLSTLVPDYSALTASTTAEYEGRFQQFHPEEIVQIINMLEEMPRGMHKLPELKYLLRRLDGTSHPLYGDAPAVAWPTAGYIEFMESGFNTSSISYAHRLIIHEKSHFLWEHQFDEQLRSDWIQLGGWYPDSTSESGWSTTEQTSFVSAYAHLKNPDEDMAESISYFVINPDLLKSRAIMKYEFVRDRIMQGNIYLSQIRDDLTFQVYNLFPDYVFPGKIKRVDIRVEGAPEEDKRVTVEIELHALDTELEGAKHAFMRISSEIGTFTDLYLYPVDEQGNTVPDGLGSTLRGSFELSKHAKSGYWRTPQIVITDAVGNQRMEGINDFGWQLYIDNPQEDVTPPAYAPNTARLTKSVTTMEGQEVQVIHAYWGVEEDTSLEPYNPCYASLNDEIPETYRFEEYGTFDTSNERCQVDFVMPHYMPTSTYRMNQISILDIALNRSSIYFTSPGDPASGEDVLDEPPAQIELVTNNPDVEPPQLDLTDITVEATPINPESPNGETLVTLTFRVKDNISGYRIAGLMLRDPQGGEHHYWAYNEGTWSLFPQEDPTLWQTYTRSIILPAGSAPGTWGVAEMTIYDRASNFKSYDFTEIVHFDVIDGI